MSSWTKVSKIGISSLTQGQGPREGLLHCHACVHSVQVPIAGGSLRQSPRNKHESSSFYSCNESHSSRFYIRRWFTLNCRLLQIISHRLVYNVPVWPPADDTVTVQWFWRGSDPDIFQVPGNKINSLIPLHLFFLARAGKVIGPVNLRSPVWCVRGRWCVSNRDDLSAELNAWFLLSSAIHPRPMSKLNVSFWKSCLRGVGGGVTMASALCRTCRDPCIQCMFNIHRYWLQFIG